MNPRRPNPPGPRYRAWQQQAIGIILIAFIAFCYVMARYRHALLK